MFLLFGLRGGRHGKIFLAARIALLLAFLVIVFAFHPHGTTLDILQGVKVVLVIALIGFAWMLRRKQRRAPAHESD
ncbi:MAG TPA: hypothetical protein VFA97_13790 [Gaiellaceae bacterium]|nr:hypothetical protein [Gaiellaceae bacterium]